jgi:radical SAM protein with 4Fe4S-binding SPASM domain
MVEEQTDAQEETVERLSDPDPFALPRRVQESLSSCCKTAETTERDTKYLWVHLSAGNREEMQADDVQAAPTLSQWLNVVDEAASLGVEWIVISMDTSLTAFPDVVKVCQWAQETYDMIVGLHAESPELLLAEKEVLQSLNAKKTQILVKQEVATELSELESIGFRLLIADPQEYGGKPECEGPKHMVFTNPQGHLYTCGLVKEKDQYALGTIFEGTFRELLNDPSLPHSVKPAEHKVSEGCDGCPALLNHHLKKAGTSAF